MPSEVHGLAPLLQGYDMPTSIHFYRDGLGFTLINHAPGRFSWGPAAAQWRRTDAQHEVWVRRLTPAQERS